MHIFDTHCDTISCLLDNGGNLYRNTLHIDIEKMEQYEQYTQFFAAFIDPLYYGNAYQRCKDIIGKFYQELEKNQQTVAFCKSYNEFLDTQKNIRVFLSIEGGEGIQTIETLHEFYELGVRCIALTWNHTNSIASGILDDNPQYGLSEFGKDIVREMNRLGIIVDVSHLSEKAFWDVIAITKKPIIASHSNAKALCGHKRNLTDEQFMAIAANGGCVGINFCPYFLNDSGRADINDIVAHISHFIALGGEHHVGIGADFDGIGILPEGIRSCADVKAVFKQLLKDNFDENVILNIQNRNFEDILRKSL